MSQYYYNIHVTSSPGHTQLLRKAEGPGERSLVTCNLNKRGRAKKVNDFQSVATRNGCKVRLYSVILLMSKYGHCIRGIK